MHQCLINNELPNLVSRLRQEYPFNFKEILETARNLKNLNENVFKETLRFFGDDNLDDDEDSASSLEDKNLVDRVIYNDAITRQWRAHSTSSTSRRGGGRRRKTTSSSNWSINLARRTGKELPAISMIGPTCNASTDGRKCSIRSSSKDLGYIRVYLDKGGR